MKKIISMMIVLSMLLSLALPAFGADELSAKKADLPRVIVKLSDMGTISKAGLKSSTEYSKSGSFTAVLAGEALRKSTTISEEKTDLSDGEYVEFYMYNPIAAATAFALAFVSDNPATSGLDYYYALVPCNYQGWKLNSYRLASLRLQGTPNGFDSIEKIMIIPGHGGSMVDFNSKLFIDDIVLTATESENANVEQSNKVELPPTILWEAKEGDPGVVEKFGKFAKQWGPGEEALLAGVGIKAVLEDKGAEKYRDIVIEMYSVNNTNQKITCPIYGFDNPDTAKSDFYKGYFNITWGGEWRDVRMAISGGTNDVGDFKQATGEPLEKPYQGEYLSFAARFNTSDAVYPDTELYISKIYLDGEKVGKVVENPTGEIILPDRYDPEKMTDYVAMVKEKHPDKHHPRLFITDELLARIQKYKDIDPFMKTAYNAVKKAADDCLDVAPTAGMYKGSSGAEAFNRTVETVAKNCGFMYLLTGDTKYADRVWVEVENMLDTELPWTQTSTGLDGGHVASGFALAYDWLYDYLTKDQKRLMRNAIMTHALDYALRIRNGGGYMNFRNNVIGANNKGFVTAALAICDEPGYENLCNEYINLVVDYTPDALLFQYAPEGNYSEGLGYWRYSYSSTLYMTNAMKTAMGTDCGLEEYPGLDKTGYFPFAMRGTVKAFNFADANADALREGDPVYFYIAERYNIPQLAAYRLETYEKYGGAEANDLLWYNPEAGYQVDWRTDLPKDYILDGLEPVAILRSGYDPNTIYFAAKGGNSMTGHDHYDGGSFVLDVYGTRWFEDPGAEIYFPDAPRNWYYRIRTEGHNCIVFDQNRGWETGGQSGGTNQFDTKTPIVDSGATNASSYAVFDMQPVYQETVKEYRRGFALINNRTQMIVQDEFETLEPYELHSYYHTSKGNIITINPDGKSLTMKNKNGKYCKVNFITDIPNLTVGVMDAVHQPSSPQPGPDNTPGLDNSNLQKIVLHADKVTKGKITMVITPMLEDLPVQLPKQLDLADWDKHLENTTALTGISIDGIPLAEFEEGIGSYNFETEKVGTVTATAGDDVELSITQANALGEAALIKATNKVTGDSFTYKVSFSPLTIPGVTSGVEYTSIYAPLISEEIRPPELMFDGDLSTRFTMDAYDGSATFTVDAGSSRYITGFSFAFYGGKNRKNKFTMQLSEDNENWTTVFDGFSPGDTDALLTYEITPTWGRYIKFIGWGCYESDEETKNSSWNSINEFVINEDVVDFADTTGHWAQSEILFSRTHKLVNGIGDNMYMPENSVTRAEFLTMMVRACAFPEFAYEEGTFGDVKADDWFSTAVMTAKEKGIIPADMTADGNFYPNQLLTREEMCAIAVLSYTAAASRGAIAAKTTSIFNDLSDGPYLDYIDRAIGLRIVNGMSANTFAPKANITRAQAAAILRRVYLKIFNVNN